MKRNSEGPNLYRYLIKELRSDFTAGTGNGVLAISADPETGDLLIEPSAYSSRQGVLACRWNITGLKSSLELVAPFFQGIRMKLDDPRIKNFRWKWPQYWEAGFAVLQSKDGGFWIHTQDDRYRFKAVQTGTESDPSHPVYTQIRDFQYRDVETKQLQGWSWYKSRGIGVPESNLNRLNNRDKKVMVKIHPGLSMWRSILGENILKAVRELSLETVFIDVTLCMWNIDNCIIESMAPTEGMNLLIKQVARLGKGLIVGGEGLNAINAQGQSFAQAHLFRSWQTSTEGLERAGGCNLNEFLFGKLCRKIGYSSLGGRNKDEELRMNIHLEHGAIPTITIRNADEILNPNPAVKKMLDIAAG